MLIISRLDVIYSAPVLKPPLVVKGTWEDAVKRMQEDLDDVRRATIWNGVDPDWDWSPTHCTGVFLATDDAMFIKAWHIDEVDDD